MFLLVLSEGGMSMEQAWKDLTNDKTDTNWLIACILFLPVSVASSIHLLTRSQISFIFLLEGFYSDSLIKRRSNLSQL